MNFLRIRLLLILCLGAQYLSAQTNPERPILQRYEAGRHRNVIAADFPNLLLGLNSTCLSGGIVYERFIDRTAHTSVITAINGYHGSPGFVKANEVNRTLSVSGIYASAGLLFHNNGSDRRVDLSMGPKVIVGTMNRKIQPGLGSSSRTREEKDVLMLGLSADVQFSIQSTNGFIFQPHLSIGMLNAGSVQSILFRAGLQCGYRF